MFRRKGILSHKKKSLLPLEGIGEIKNSPPVLDVSRVERVYKKGESMKTFFATIIMSIVLIGCGSIQGSAISTVCNTVDQICTYKNLLCNVTPSTAKTTKNDPTANLESYYRLKLTQLAESLRVQSQPVQ